MSVPDYQTLMLPLLKIVAKSSSATDISDIREALAQEFKLNDEDLNQRVPSGKQRLLDNRVGWARTYLVKAGLLESPARGQVQITAEGRKALSGNINRIDSAFLRQYPSFNDFHGPDRLTVRKQAVESRDRSEADDERTPEERISDAVAEYNETIAANLLERLRSNTPAFFEDVVVQLLLAMNYGGGIANAGQVLGRSGDGGVDGVIKEDRLGLDAVYIQAKRYRDESTIGRPHIQAFVGALSSKKVRKGVFITLSSFSREAQEYIKEVDYRIVLIDGEQLVQLMIEHDVGVSEYQVFKLKKIDEDFF
jgi:restriction system protein